MKFPAPSMAAAGNDPLEVFAENAAPCAMPSEWKSRASSCVGDPLDGCTCQTATNSPAGSMAKACAGRSLTESKREAEGVVLIWNSAASRGVPLASYRRPKMPELLKKPG